MEQQPAQVDRVRSTIAQYEAVGRGSHREADFLRSCEKMLVTRGYVTPSMERWMLHILEMGGPKMPTAAALEEVRRIEDYLPDAGVQEDLLQNACDILRSGRDLSDRHREAVEAVILRIARSRREGPLREGELRALTFVRRVLDGYPYAYKRERHRSFETAYAVCSNFEAGEAVSRADWETLASTATRLRDIAHPKFKVGDLVYVMPFCKVAVVTSLPEPDPQGHVCYSVLVDGQVKLVSQISLRVRIPRDD